MKIYLAGGTGKRTGKELFRRKIGRLFSFADLFFTDRSFYAGYEIEWYVGKKVHGIRRGRNENIPCDMD